MLAWALLMGIPFSLYLHIPFCYHKCPYCDFNTFAVANIPELNYVDSLLSELDMRAAEPAWHARPIRSIFFGGGTPSVLGVASVQRIMNTVSALFPVEDTIEVSFEANPGSLTTDYLRGIREAGINRLSLGSQSMHADTLRALGRQHTPDQIEASVANARAAGFKNISMDLMYGAPSQNMEMLQRDIEKFIALEIQHISCYALTIEKATPFYGAFKRGVLKVPDEDAVAEMMELINCTLPLHGFERYEISNFALDGFQARHNLAYWDASDYLGLGAGAHSFHANPAPKRWSNLALPSRFITSIVEKGTAVAWTEELDPASAMFEFIFLGLRKIRGVDLLAFQNRFGRSLESVYAPVLRVLEEQKLIRKSGTHLFLTRRGQMLADAVTENFAEPEVEAQQIA